MPEASIKKTFSCTKEQLLEVILDYEKYPDFLSDVKEVKVIKRNGKEVLLEYSVSVVKDITYRLLMKEIDDGVSWTFDSGDMFKKLDGAWSLESKGDKVHATYSVDAEFGMFVPGFIAKSLINVTLPNMMESYAKRIKELY